MLSVIIETLNSERPLACTLSGLVPAVVEGLLRRVTVIDHGSGDGTVLVAEGAGCAFHGLAERDVALNGIRTDWVLFLKPGAMPQEGWGEAVRRHMEGGGGPARFSLPEEGRPGNIRKIFGGGPSLDAGLLVRLDLVQPLFLEGIGSDDLPRRLKPLRLKHRILPPERH
ncbi:hypothetical protein [Brucella abortus]|uniref:hypothetical protein n=1 Tax=Brucella abortus TaxID=235 RepID=UPI0001B4A33E|nr:hypothetical protein [Brucella abortus]KFH21144.1 glycosyl transferase [Brucella abortus LMN1]KFH22668.1 glycosyl transferase [Brucella abortus LMN2]AIJ93500.1 putative glycosyltransferase [Brucella abortus bv. 2 str. 86/8/59]AIN89915.1 glycosyl transferase [Brucella abortus]AZS90653.1 glycosyl transferase [Brucella abortus]